MLLSKFQVDWSVQEKTRKVNFQDSSHGDHLGLPTERILATFDLKVTLMLLQRSKINGLFDSREEVKK